MPNTTETPGKQTAKLRKQAEKQAYDRLIARFPLRPIRSESQLDAASRLAGRLAVRSDLSAAERDYLEVLGDLIEKYEAEHHPITTAGRGVDSLRFLIEENNLSLSDLSRGAGIRISTLSEILSGKRSLALAHLHKLGRYFHVEPALFLDERG